MTSRARRLPLALTILSLGAPTTAVAADAIDLTPGQSRFWAGGQIDDADVPDASLCGVAGPCPEWQLKVAPGATRLRVAIDTPSREDTFELDVIDPSGKVAASAQASNSFDAEAFVAKPSAGAWTVRVIPQGATQAFFRLRAKLEGAPDPKVEKHMLLPDLKAVPPYEFGFAAPANPLNAAYPPDTVNPPLSVAGQQPVSCAADEMAPTDVGGGAAKVCLRLTTGPINVGDGPFVKLFDFSDDLVAGKVTPPILRGPARQRILWSDGSTTTRDAGTYSFHTTHAHFHDDGILTYEIFSVDGPAGSTLTPAGKGTKSGFCPADQLIGQWRQFTQDPPGTFGGGDTSTGSCYGVAGGAFTLTRGWGDVYRYQRPGQYIEFSGDGDGYYVVRATVDKSDTTLETNERNNASYAFIRVIGQRVELLERGQGTSHLDPLKEVFSGYGPASQDGVGGELPAQGEPSAAAPQDRTAPRVTRVRVVGGRRLAFTLREPATVTLTARRGSRRTKTAVVHAQRGTTTVALARLVNGPGHYRIGVVAHDAAGNFSRSAIVRLTRR